MHTHILMCIFLSTMAGCSYDVARHDRLHGHDQHGGREIDSQLRYASLCACLPTAFACICVCVCVCVCVCICNTHSVIYVYRWVCIYTGVSADGMPSHIYECKHVCIYVYKQVLVCLDSIIRSGMHMCRVCVHAYTYTHTYIHTYTHTWSRAGSVT
jgi:hypothetical protein